MVSPKLPGSSFAMRLGQKHKCHQKHADPILALKGEWGWMVGRRERGVVGARAAGTLSAPLAPSPLATLPLSKQTVDLSAHSSSTIWTDSSHSVLNLFREGPSLIRDASQQRVPVWIRVIAVITSVGCNLINKY